MLGHTYRYQVHNGTAGSVTCTVKTRAWKLASDGSRTDASESTRISAVSVGAGAYSNSSTIDNSSDKNLGADVFATLAPGGSVTGLVRVLRQVSTDGGSTWPADGEGEPVCSVYFNASSTSVNTQGEAG
jgi:hypothetical protein